MSTLFLGGIATFVVVFLKGFQFKNVIGNHYLLTFVTSCLMSAGDIFLIGLVVQKGWAMAIPCGLGGATGMTLSMWIHDQYVKPRDRVVAYDRPGPHD